MVIRVPIVLCVTLVTREIHRCVFLAIWVRIPTPPGWPVVCRATTARFRRSPERRDVSTARQARMVQIAVERRVFHAVPEHMPYQMPRYHVCHVKQESIKTPVNPSHASIARRGTTPLLQLKPAAPRVNHTPFNLRLECRFVSTAPSIRHPFLNVSYHPLRGCRFPRQPARKRILRHQPAPSQIHHHRHPPAATETMRMPSHLHLFMQLLRWRLLLRFYYSRFVRGFETRKTHRNSKITIVSLAWIQMSGRQKAVVASASASGPIDDGKQPTLHKWLAKKRKAEDPLEVAMEKEHENMRAAAAELERLRQTRREIDAKYEAEVGPVQKATVLKEKECGRHNLNLQRLQSAKVERRHQEEFAAAVKAVKPIPHGFVPPGSITLHITMMICRATNIAADTARLIAQYCNDIIIVAAVGGYVRDEQPADARMVIVSGSKDGGTAYHFASARFPYYGGRQLTTIAMTGSCLYRVIPADAYATSTHLWRLPVTIDTKRYPPIDFKFASHQMVGDSVEYKGLMKSTSRVTGVDMAVAICFPPDSRICADTLHVSPHNDPLACVRSNPPLKLKTDQKWLRMPPHQIDFLQTHSDAWKSAGVDVGCFWYLLEPVYDRDDNAGFCVKIVERALTTVRCIVEARFLPASPSAASNWERFECVPNSETSLRLAHFCNEFAFLEITPCYGSDGNTLAADPFTFYRRSVQYTISPFYRSSELLFDAKKGHMICVEDTRILWLDERVLNKPINRVFGRVLWDETNEKFTRVDGVFVHNVGGEPLVESQNGAWRYNHAQLLGDVLFADFRHWIFRFDFYPEPRGWRFTRVVVNLPSFSSGFSATILD